MIILKIFILLKNTNGNLKLIDNLVFISRNWKSLKWVGFFLVVLFVCIFFCLFNKMLFGWPTFPECLALFYLKGPVPICTYNIDVIIIHVTVLNGSGYTFCISICVLSESGLEMINYRAIFLVKLWINMFSISVAVHKQENPLCLPSSWLKTGSIHHLVSVGKIFTFLLFGIQ